MLPWSRFSGFFGLRKAFMNDTLIIDVGMHTGKDTEFYLKKGYNVVGVEANNALVDQVKTRLKDFVKTGKLTICDVAIAEYEGEIEFYINESHDDWGTIRKSFADRNVRFGTKNSLVKVPCTTFAGILKRFGVPYYLKIDIEGADTLCLHALQDFDDKPKYISLEAGLNSFEETFTELSLLWNLGYRQFKIVNQANNPHIRCPDPPREGKFVDYTFDFFCSGPFGEEAPGKWLTIEQTFLKYRWLLKEQKYFGGQGILYKTRFRKWYEKLKGEMAGWYDFHAKLGDLKEKTDKGSGR
jgi:FkbM family methyltransferase